MKGLKRLPGRERVRSLPKGLCRRWERESGVELGDVRVHENSLFPRDFGAGGLALGTEIYLAPGCKDLLLHELVHVIQQKQGRAVREREEELEAEARLERPPVPRPPAEPTPLMQFCKWCGDRRCTLSAPKCRMAKIVKLPHVRAAVRRVKMLDDAFLIAGYGDMTWNGHGERRPAPVGKVWDSVLDRDVMSKIRRGQKWKCPYCEREFASAEAGDPEVDHYFPWREYMRRCLFPCTFGILPRYVAVALGSDPKNLVVACGSCNASKRDRKPGTPEFRQWKADRMAAAAAAAAADP